MTASGGLARPWPAHEAGVAAVVLIVAAGAWACAAWAMCLAAQFCRGQRSLRLKTGPFSWPG
jgi:hypothetical protein